MTNTEIELEALKTERDAMISDNENRRKLGLAPAFNDSLFVIATQMRALKTPEEKKAESNDIVELDGNLDRCWKGLSIRVDTKSKTIVVMDCKTSASLAMDFECLDEWIEMFLSIKSGIKGECK